MISSTTCVVVTCSRPTHYDSLKAARADHQGDADDRPWRWDDRDPVCPRCLQRDREAACTSHQWEIDPSIEGSKSTLQRRECTLCNASDFSRDNGRTWVVAARTATNAVIAEMEFQFTPIDRVLPELLGATPKGVHTVSCCTATCDDCGTDYECDVTIHFATEAELVDECTSNGWAANSGTGRVTCDECRSEAEEEGAERSAPVHIKGQMSLPDFRDPNPTQGQS